LVYFSEFLSVDFDDEDNVEEGEDKPVIMMGDEWFECVDKTSE
jgi:hypothetical protein